MSPGRGRRGGRLGGRLVGMRATPRRGMRWRSVSLSSQFSTTHFADKDALLATWRRIGFAIDVIAQGDIFTDW